MIFLILAAGDLNKEGFVSDLSVPGLTNMRTVLTPREWMVAVYLRF
jgi:hypothetical protein